MSIIRVTRGVARYNIQIGPISQALNHNPGAILSVTDYFEPIIAQAQNASWIPVNEVSKSWGLLPFYASKRLLDYFCLDLQVPVMYVGCSAGKHRSPMITFAWLTSLGMTPETATSEFIGLFENDGMRLDQKFRQDIKLGYIPDNLPLLYKYMKEFPSASFRDILINMDLYERISYPVL